MEKYMLLAVVFTILGVTFAKPVEKDEHPFEHTVNECRAELELNDPTLKTDTIQTISKNGRLLLCVHVKLGLMDPNGNINVDTLKKTILKMGLTESKTNEIITRCGKRSSDKANEAAVELFNCIHKDVKAKQDEHPFDNTITECKIELGLKNPEDTDTVDIIAKDGRLSLCIIVKLDIMDSKGTINEEAFRKSLLRLGLKESKADEILTRCNHPSSEEPEKRASELIKCVHQDVDTL